MGLFGRKRRSSVDATAQDPGPTIPPTSAVISTATGSTVSTRPTSLRKPPVRPQPTFERIVPPPVQSNEISLLREQILDLERAFSDRDLFDFLLADIDRNRLTQIVTIFADTGRYVEMQSAMELAEKLDDLIRRRLDETHEQQRRVLASSQSETEKDIQTIISEAESIDISSLSESEIQNRISYFEFHFYRLQDSDFALLLRLSECIESFRKSLRDIESRGSLPTVTPDDVSQSQPGNPITTSEEVMEIEQPVHQQVEAPVPQQVEPSPADDEGDEEPWETFTPGPETVPNPPPMNNDCSSIYGPIDTSSREATLEAVAEPPEPLVEAQSQEFAPDQIVVAQPDEISQDIDTDTWETFHNGQTSPSAVVETCAQPEPTVEVYRISSTCEPMDTPPIDGTFSRRNVRIQKDVLVAWLHAVRRKQNYSRCAQQVSVSRRRHMMSAWNGLAQEVRVSREKGENDLKISVIHMLQEHHKLMSEKCEQAGRVHDAKLVKMAFTAWLAQSRDKENLILSYEQKRETQSLRSVFRNWCFVVKSKNEKVSNHLRIRELVMQRMVVSALRSHVDSMTTKADDFYSRSIMRKLSRFMEQSKKSKEQALVLQHRIDCSRTAAVFNGWKNVHKRRCQVAESMLKICSSNIGKTFEFFKRNCAVCPSHVAKRAAIESIIQALTAVGLREKRAVFDTLLDSTLVSTTPRGQMELFSPSMHKSPIVQYYSISDPEEARQETPPSVGPIEELKQTTNDIIVKTQIFLSQRQLKSVSPPPIESRSTPNFDHSRKIADWLENHKRSCDNYFTDFERKWAIEEQKWHI